MPACFCAPGVSVRCGSVRAAIGASSIVGRTAAASPGVNHYAPRGGGISKLDAVGTVMPSASAATGAGAAKARAGK